jgi:hypothetical protein
LWNTSKSGAASSGRVASHHNRFILYIVSNRIMNDKSIKILFNFLLIVLIVVSVTSVGAADPELEWYASIGTGSFNELAYSVLLAEDGGFILAGSKSTSTNGLDFYLAKTSANGTVEWERSYGGYADDSANSVARSSDGGYVLVGYTKSFGAGNSDIMMIKTDASGQQEWFATFGGARDDIGESVQMTAGGGFIIAGGSRSFDPMGSYDFYLIATDPSGGMIWNKTYGGNDFDYATSVQQTSDGGFIMAGGTGIFLSFVKDILLVKADPQGNAQWSKTYGASGPENAYSVVQTSDGGYLIGGSTRSYGSSEEAFLVKTDAAGELEWQNYFGGASDESASSAIQTSDGNYLLVGYTKSHGAGLTDVYLVQVDRSGNMEAMAAFGGMNDDFGYDIIQLQDGSCVIAGSTRSYFHAPTQDAYLIKTNVFIDFLPPALTGKFPAAGSVVGPMTAIGASFEDTTGVDASSVRVYLDSVDITGSCIISASAFSYSPPSPMGEGAHSVSVTSADLNGIGGSQSWSFTVDSQPPVVSAITPANRSSTSSSRPIISAAFNDTTGVNVTGVNARLDLIDITTATQITATGTQYVPPSDMPQGLHTVILIVPDLYGNTRTASWTFRVDTTAPTISSISPSNGATLQIFGDTVTISASFSDNAEISMGSIRLLVDGADVTSSATVTTTTVSCTRSLGQGTHTAQLTVADGAGNINTSTVTFTVNNLTPIVMFAAIALIALVTVLLLLSRRKKPKEEAAPRWEKPAPPPPPPETYVAGQDGEVPTMRQEARRYTPPLLVDQPSAPPPEPEAEAEKVPEAAPAQLPETPGITIIEGAKPAPAEEPKQAPQTMACPKCGSSNWVGASRCWYCESQLK